MNCKDDLLLLKAYRSIYMESSQSNMVDDITNAITKAMNEHGFFGNSSILKEISNKHRTVSGLDFNNKSSLEYRKWKSETSRQVNNNSNQNFQFFCLLFTFSSPNNCLYDYFCVN